MTSGSPGARLDGRSAHGQALDLEGRLADAAGNPLAVLAAGADARIELKVVADHRRLLHDLRPAADQGRALDCGTDLAVLDQVGLGGGEGELARRDVDLA